MFTVTKSKPKMKNQILAQAESRALRIGQEGNVMCRYLMAKGIADDVLIWEMLKSKEKTLIKVGIFNETLSDATNVVATSSTYAIMTDENTMGVYVCFRCLLICRNQ